MRSFYGRRSGRRLSTAKFNLLDSGLSQLRINPDIVNDNHKHQCADFFQNGNIKCMLEIGFGQGEHLISFMQNNLEWNVIGADPFINGVASLLDKTELINKNNIRLWPDDIKVLLPQLENEQFDQITILFPDPWPKLRHHKRRLIQLNFVEQCIKLLKPKGQLIIATDHQDYLCWIINVLQPITDLVPQFSWQNLPTHKPYEWQATTYEAKAIKQGRICYYLNFHCKK